MKKIKEAGVDEILFLNCTDWNKFEMSDQLCNNYIDTITDWLEEGSDIKVNKNKICTSISETYSIMMGSKILVSSGGTFSFIPGITKGKNFISPKLTGDCSQEIMYKFRNLQEDGPLDNVG